MEYLKILCVLLVVGRSQALDQPFINFARSPKTPNASRSDVATTPLPQFQEDTTLYKAPPTTTFLGINPTLVKVTSDKYYQIDNQATQDSSEEPSITLDLLKEPLTTIEEPHDQLIIEDLPTKVEQATSSMIQELTTIEEPHDHITVEGLPTRLEQATSSMIRELTTIEETHDHITVEGLPTRFEQATSSMIQELTTNEEPQDYIIVEELPRNLEQTTSSMIQELTVIDQLIFEELLTRPEQATSSTIQEEITNRSINIFNKNETKYEEPANVLHVSGTFLMEEFIRRPEQTSYEPVVNETKFETEDASGFNGKSVTTGADWQETTTEMVQVRVNSNPPVRQLCSTLFDSQLSTETTSLPTLATKLGPKDLEDASIFSTDVDDEKSTTLAMVLEEIDYTTDVPLQTEIIINLVNLEFASPTDSDLNNETTEFAPNLVPLKPSTLETTSSKFITVMPPDIKDFITTSETTPRTTECVSQFDEDWEIISTVSSLPITTTEVSEEFITHPEEVLQKTITKMNQGLVDVPLGYPEIQTLNLAYNSIVNLTTFVFLNNSYKEVRKLYLQENRIATIHINAFRGLWELNLLDLSDNNITTFDPYTFKTNTKLEKLLLMNNYISFNRLQTFILSQSIEHLVLANNRIDQIYDLTFLGVPNLRNLILSNNYIYGIAANSFKTLNKLQYLSLANTGVYRLAETMFSRVPQSINLEDTPLAAKFEPPLKMLTGESVLQLLMLSRLMID